MPDCNLPTRMTPTSARIFPIRRNSPSGFEIPVIPAEAGIHLAHQFATVLWIPAYAGMTQSKG